MKYGPFAVLLALLLLGAAGITPQTTPQSPQESVAPVPAPPGPDKEAEETTPLPVDPAERVRLLKLQHRVAQLMIVTMQGAPAPDYSDREFIERYPPGGVIIPKLLRPSSAADYVRSLRGLPIEAKLGIPMFIGTNIYTLPRELRAEVTGDFQALPTLLAIAAAGEPDTTQRLSALVGDHLSLMGFNLHMGPSLAFAPTLPDTRGSLECLGSSPRFVAESGGIIMQALMDKQVAPMVMDFPGGAGNRTPRTPGVLLTPRSLLKEADLFPFIEAIEADMPIIHVGNTLAPTLDPSNGPASLSKAVIGDLLRRELGFDGIIVAGPMDSNDIGVKYDPTKAAILALQAGADMILWNQAGRRVMKTVDEIVSAVGEGTLSQEVIDAALTRVVTVKDRLGLREKPLPEPEKAEALGKKKSYSKEAYELERRSVTLVQNRGNVLPLNQPRSAPIGVTGVVGGDALSDALRKYIKAVSQQDIVTAKYGGEIYDFEVDRIVRYLTSLKTVVVVVTPDIKVDSQLRLLNSLRESGVAVVVVLVGYPSILPHLADADAIVLCYTTSENANDSMQAIADVLVGQGPLSILPSGDEVQVAAGTSVLFNVLDMIRCPAGRLPVTVEEPYVAGLAVPYDPTFTIKKVEWDFGDGKRGKEFRMEHTYQQPGRYPVTVKVIDKKGHETSRTAHVIVQ